MVRTPYYIDVTTLKKGSWSPEEDQKLKAYIKRFGIWKWTEMPKAAGLSRSGKSCRLRWVNYLKPGIKRGNFSCEEEETILKLHEMLGNRWSAIAAKLPGRTDNEIKNYWYTKRKKLLKGNPAPRNKSQGPKTSTVEPKLTGSPKAAGSSMGFKHPWSPQIFIHDSSSSMASLVDKIQLEGNSGDPMSTQPYAYDSSSSITSPAVGTDKNQMMEGSMESATTFGDLQAFPAEDLFMLSDYFWETYPDLEVAFPICEEWVQEPLWTWGSCNYNFWLNLYVKAEIDGI